MRAKKRHTRDSRLPEPATVPCAMTNGVEWESHEDLSVLLGSIADAVIKSRDGIIVWCNDRVEDVFGYSKEELLGTDGSVLYSHGAECSRRQEQARKAADERGHYRSLTEVTRKDGTTGFVELAISRIPGRKPAEHVTVAVDVTKRVLAQQALQQAKDELERRVVERTSELERANEELRRSEERFRALIENSSNGITVLDAEGKVTYESPAVARITGYEPQERLGRHSLDLVYPDDMPKVSERLRRLLRHPGGTERIDLRILHKDGTWRTLEVVARNLLGDPAVRGIVVNQRDITGRKKGEERLTALYAALNASADGMIVIDADGVVKDVNESVVRRQGYSSKDEMVGRKALDFVLPEDLDRVMASAEQMTANGHVENVEYRMVARDGEPLPVESNGLALRGKDGDLLGYVIIARDVRERKKALEALKTSEEKYRAVVENANEAIVVAQDGMLKFFNPKAMEITGFDQDELDSKPFIELIHPDDREMVAERHLRRLQGEQLPGVYSFRVVGKTGKVVWVEINAIAFTWEGKPATLNFLSDVTQRKEAEEAILEAERRYRAIFDNRLLMVYVMDGQGTFLDASDSALERLGYTRDDLGKVSMMDIMHPDDIPKAMEALIDLLTTGFQEQPLEYRLTTGSGEMIHVLASSIPLERSDDRYLELGIALDITESKRAEDQIRESEERLSRYLELSPDGIYISDREAAFVYVNRAAERLVGYHREELIGRNWLDLDLLPPEYLEKAARQLEASAAGKPTGPEEFELKRKDGTRVAVEISTYPIDEGDSLEVIGIARDITERRRMEQALRESEESLRALIDNAPEAITAYDLTGTVIDCNRRGEEMLGYSRGELVGRGIFEIGAIPDDYIARASRALEKGEWDRNRPPFEFDLLRKDGSRITIEATTIAVERGGQTQIICIARDVTQRKHMEQQLQLAGRLAAVGELAAGVAHELNNPLAAVQGFAQYLAERDSVDEATRGDLRTIFKEAQRATKITGNLLSFARKHAPEKRFLSINDVLERSLELHAYRMRVNNVEVVQELDPDLPNTMADFHQMQQVFVNVVTNAEQAMTQERDGGRLVVRTEHVGDVIRISFADDGPGMSSEVLKSVFDPFFTTKEVGKGTGLGLSICYGIVQEHGGQLYAESEPGRGATFVVEIPVVAEGAQARSEADPSGR